MSFLLLLWPALVFISVYVGQPWLGCIALLGLGAQLLWPALSQRRGWAWLGMTMIAVVAIGVALLGEARVYLHALPVLIFLLLALFFGRTLRRGSVPLVTRIAAAARYIELENIDRMPADVVGYTRKVTWAWTLGFLFFVVEDLLLIYLRLPAEMAVLINVGNFMAVSLLLVIEYLYHSRRYPNPSHRHIGDFIRAVSRYDYRQLLDD